MSETYTPKHAPEGAPQSPETIHDLLHAYHESLVGLGQNHNQRMMEFEDGRKKWLADDTANPHSLHATVMELSGAPAIIRSVTDETRSNLRTTMNFYGTHALKFLTDPSDVELWTYVRNQLRTSYVMPYDSGVQKVVKNASREGRIAIDIALDGIRWNIIQTKLRNAFVYPGDVEIQRLHRDASSDAARQGMIYALDAVRWQKIQEKLQNTFVNPNDAAVTRLLKETSTKSAQRAMNATLDWSRWQRIEGALRNPFVDTDSSAVRWQIKGASSPAAAEMFKRNLTRIKETVSSAGHTGYTGSASSAEGISVDDDFLNDILEKLFKMARENRSQPTGSAGQQQSPRTPQPEGAQPRTLSPKQQIDAEIKALYQQGMRPTKIREKLARRLHPDVNNGDDTLMKYASSRIDELPPSNS